VRVLVTGAAGYIGGSVVRALAARGHEPIALIHHQRGALPADVELRQADILAEQSLLQALGDVDTVCHLAGLTSGRESLAQPVEYFRRNVSGTLALLDVMAEADVHRLVFASTAAAYGTPEQQPMNEELPDNPPNPYAASKVAAEDAIGWQARAVDLSATVLRIFNAAGGRDPDSTRIVPRVLAVAAGAAPQFDVNGDGTVMRDYLHVDDVGEAFVATLDRAAEPDRLNRYNIGSGRGTSVLDVVAAAERVTGRSIQVIHRPAVNEPPALVCDPARAAAELGWKPRRTNLDDIVRDAWAATYLS
jgi:UDP-glucose-4-epimerase GalE